MLVVSRKIGETVVVGTGKDAVTFLIVDVGGGKVRVGIEAPREMLILRGELVGKQKGGSNDGTAE